MLRSSHRDKNGTDLIPILHQQARASSLWMPVQHSTGKTIVIADSVNLSTHINYPAEFNDSSGR